MVKSLRSNGKRTERIEKVADREENANNGNIEFVEDVTKAIINAKPIPFRPGLDS